MLYHHAFGRTSRTRCVDQCADLALAIKGNRPGQVAHLCERAGLQLTALRRLRLGRISLAGLPVGEWRYLMPYERF